MRQFGLITFVVRVTAALLLVVAPLLFTAQASAAYLISRSVRVGSSQAGANTFHEFTFTIPTAGTLGSIELEYCTNTPFPGTDCTIPMGLDVSGAAITNQTGATGFSIHGSTTANKLVLSRPPSANLALQAALYRLENVINNSTSNEIVYVRISTFAADDATGPRIDQGGVVYATIAGVLVEGYVPPYLTFCTGITVALDCTSTEGAFINLGELSKTTANTGTSQYSGATNDPGGFSTTLTGTTMTSGNDIIPALASPSRSSAGTSQFGVNLRKNSNPSVGQNRTGTGTSVAVSDYNVPNLFKFDSEVISNSVLPTDFNRFTISYLVNASSNQPAGIYSATITYIATAAF